MPYKFIEDFKKPLDPNGMEVPIGPIGLVHTRAANVGHPDDNSNNHPVIYERGGRVVIATHNGTIGNLDEAYEKLGVEPIAEVDSALIPAALCVLGVEKGMEFLQAESGGSAAFAALLNDGSLVLARDSSPLFIAQPAPGVLLWSSEAEPMKKLSEHANEFGLPMWKIWGVADRQYWHWAADGTTLLKGKFNLPAMKVAPQYRRGTSAATAQQYSFPATEAKPVALPAPPMTEMAKRACGFQPPHTTVKLEGDAEEHRTRHDPERCLPMEKVHGISCNWAGCFKKALFKIHWSGARWIPLCESHKNKWQKKGHNLILSGTHEMVRKTAQAAGILA